MAADTAWDPDLLVQVESLEWQSQLLMQGFLQGLHRSPLHGFSAEFAQYRQYQPGDELRRLDWRAYARLDRLYVREFEAETNLRCQLVVDASGSMDYRSDRARFWKYDYAALLAAAAARLLLRQRDAFGLTVLQDTALEHLPPRLTQAHFFRCLGILETTRPRGPSSLEALLEPLLDSLSRRGLVLIFTDGLDEPERIEQTLDRLVFERHEVCLFQIFDPVELDFQFADSEVFEDLETGVRLPVVPEWARSRYLENMARHQERIRRRCLDSGVVHQVLTTDQPPFDALATFLGERERLQ